MESSFQLLSSHKDRCKVMNTNHHHVLYSPDWTNKAFRQTMVSSESSFKLFSSGEICFIIGIMSPILPPGPIKNAPRAIKSDCEDLEHPTFF